eukprot:GEMP01066822.1.p1 GENE.GEMP01066822.1~~GEMP01066822.1.p1  ORF type:complete len:197 (+),score=51.62 GEMP01066822.1:30-593(+)
MRGAILVLASCCAQWKTVNGEQTKLTLDWSSDGREDTKPEWVKQCEAHLMEEKKINDPKCLSLIRKIRGEKGLLPSSLQRPDCRGFVCMKRKAFNFLTQYIKLGPDNICRKKKDVEACESKKYCAVASKEECVKAVSKEFDGFCFGVNGDDFVDVADKKCASATTRTACGIIYCHWWTITPEALEIE